MVSIRALHKAFHRQNGGLVSAIDNVSLDVDHGEFLVLLGPSGCGKTTLLRSIAGLERPDHGSIDVRGRRVFDGAAGVNIRTEKRDLGMIFQSYALWPHMTVARNIAYPLRALQSGLSRKEIQAKVDRILHLLGLEAMADQFPSHLSGGQQQRVALGRALVGGRRLILFDEPLSNVDAKVRESLRRELKTMQSELGFSAVYVTHDQSEAMELADRIAVIREGRVEQIGRPEDLYYQPTSRYVADFIGAANLLEGTISTLTPEGSATVDVAFGSVQATGSGVSAGDKVSLLIRPERCTLSPERPAGTNAWKVQMGRQVFYGSHIEVELNLSGNLIRAWTKDGAITPGTPTAWLSVHPEDIRMLTS
jgi:iron(III) transport system ATP-binding protein